MMERGLIGLDISLDELISTPAPGPQVDVESYSLPPTGALEGDPGLLAYQFPSLDLFGMEYKLSVKYRSEVEFQVEDMETVLSEKFVDMDEDWFTPTVARHRMEDEARAASVGTSTVEGTRSGTPVIGMGIGLGIAPNQSRLSSTPTAIPLPSSNPAPIPVRQPSMSSYRSQNMGSMSRLSSLGGGSAAQAQRGTPGSLGTDRWGAFAQGLPFAGPAPAVSAEGSTNRVCLLSQPLYFVEVHHSS